MHGRGQPRRTALLLLALGVAWLTPPLDLAAASGLPDLAVATIAFSPASVARGQQVRVRDTTVNRGARTSPASTTRYYLSRDRIRSGTDRLLAGRSVGRLRPGRSSIGAVQVRIPATTAVGAWYVIACADALHRVRESRESNCRATGTRLRVVAAAAENFPLTPNPWSVTPTFGTGTPDGGPGNLPYAFPDNASSYAVVGPDGTRFQLDVPAGAVNQTVQLTLTPVTVVTHSPLSGGLVAGVRIAPEGLLLAQPATLTITPPTAPPSSAATGFRFFGSGTDFAMYPLDPGSTSSLHLSELATYGVGKASAADRSLLLSRPPSTAERQFQNALAPLVRTARPVATGRSAPTLVARAAGDTPTGVDANYYDHVIKPDLVAAVTDDVLAPVAVHRALAFLRELALVGADNPAWTQEATALMLQALAHGAQASYDRCVATHNLAELARLLGYGRDFAVLGASADSESTFQKMRACGRFEVDFSSHLEEHEHHPPVGPSIGRDFDAVFQVDSSPIILTMNQNGRFEGSGSVSETTFDLTDVGTAPCDNGVVYRDTRTGTGSTAGDVTATIGIVLLPNVYDTQTQTTGPAPPDGSLNIAIGMASSQTRGVDPVESYHVDGGGCGTPTSSDYTDSEWWWQYQHVAPQMLHLPIVSADRNGAIVLDTRASYDNGASGPSITDSSRVTVVHVPE